MLLRLSNKIIKNTKSHYKYPILHNNKRYYCYPLILSGGMINFFVLTQLWNPYFPRNKLLNLLMSGNVLCTLGIILPTF